jgi:selenide,water dikinase
MTEDIRKTKNKLTARVKSAGCAAKIGAAELKAILATLPKATCPDLISGIDNFEDAAVYKISEDLAVVQTVDFFPPMIDDPYLFGRIAATNALSDIYAMGARPIFALNILCFPTCDFPLEVAGEILKGSASQVAEAGATLAGGHSIESAEVIYGLAVTGLVAPGSVLTNSGAQAGDRLVLTKPIGTGVALLGYKGGLLSNSASAILFANLTSLNRDSLSAARGFPIHAATDVTGFGLIGHLHEMAKGAGLSFSLNAGQVPLLPEVVKLASEGFLPAGAYGNRRSFEAFTTLVNEVELAVLDLLFDPQTSGGLLLALAPEHCDSLLRNLSNQGIKANCLGHFTAGQPGLIEVNA